MIHDASKATYHPVFSQAFLQGMSAGILQINNSMIVVQTYSSKKFVRLHALCSFRKALEDA